MSRLIKVNKSQLIEKIRENRENHIKDYNKACVGYKKKALKQLKDLTAKVDKGEIKNINMNLATPVNAIESYDKLLVQFEWELEDELELTQSEFTKYVHDQTDFAVSAGYSNSLYLDS